jgi:hypothetical protein
MNIKPLPLAWFVDKLKANQPFIFARYGDGEWLTILGFYGMRNSNGCTFTKELSDDMRAALLRQNPYHHAILGIARRERPITYKDKEVPYGGPHIDKWLEENGITLDWYDGDMLLNESLKGNLFPLIEQIRGRRVLYIGNRRLRGLNMHGAGFFPYHAYIEPPAENAHLVKDELLTDIYKAIRQYKIDFIGWSAGLAGKVFIDEVYTRFPEVTSLDFGSLFDGYFEPLPHIKAMGRNGSRSYIRKGQHDFKALLLANTGKEKATV